MKKAIAFAFVPFALALALASPGQNESFNYSDHDSFTAPKESARENAVTSVDALAFDSNGEMLALSGKQGVISIRDVAGKKEVMTLKGHAKSVNALAFRPDGNYLASAGDDKKVRLWNLKDRLPPKDLKGHKGAVSAVAFSPNGNVLASTGEDRQVILWGVGNASEICRLNKHNEHKKKITHLFYLKDEVLLTIDEDGVIVEWDVKKQIPLRNWKAPAPKIKSAAVSPNGNWLALGTETTALQFGDLSYKSELIVYELASIKPNKIYSGSDELTAIVFSADNNYLAAVHRNETKSLLKVWDVNQGKDLNSC